MRTGNLDAEEAFYRRGLGRATAAYGGYGQNDIYANLALNSFRRGDWHGAIELVERAILVEKDDLWGGSAIGAKILIGAYAGDKTVLQLFREHQARLPGAGYRGRLGQWQMFVRAVEGLVVAGELGEAAKLYPAARDLANRGAATLLWSHALVQKIAGISAAAGHSWDAAEKHFKRALEQADSIPFRIEQPDVRRWYAWMLRRRELNSDRAKAARLLEEAIDIYEELGMPKHCELARKLL